MFGYFWYEPLIVGVNHINHFDPILPICKSRKLWEVKALKSAVQVRWTVSGKRKKMKGQMRCQARTRTESKEQESKIIKIRGSTLAPFSHFSNRTFMANINQSACSRYVSCGRCLVRNAIDGALLPLAPVP